MADDNKWLGKGRVLRRMSQIPVDVRVAAREELDRQSAFLVEQIRPAVPRDHGDLRDSLEWHRSPRLDRLRNVITEGADDESRGRKARAVEFGRPDMEAQPHFFPTYRAHKRKIRAALNKAVKTAIRRIWGAT